MTFLENLLIGGAQFCYAPADDEGGAGGGGSDGADGGNDGGNESGSDGADGNDSGADEGGQDGGNESGDGADGEDGAADDGDKKKDSDSLLNALDDDEGQSFDFSTGEKPEGFPDEYWDAENNSVNAQALFEGLKKQEKIAKDLRAKMGKGDHKPPEKPENYKLELSEELQELVPEDDPLLKAARERAHSVGMSQEAFQTFVADIVGDMAKISEDMADENSPANEEARAEYIKEQIKQIGPNGPQVLRSVQSWANELKAEGVFNEQDVETMLEEGLTSARMVQMFNRLRSRMGGSDVPMDTIDDGLPPDTEIADTINAAYESKNPAKIRAAEQLLDKRRAAGRPEKLQF